MRLALAQLNPTVGRFRANAARIEDAARRAHSAGADLLVASELCLTGYPPRDLLERADFAARQWEWALQLARRLPLPALLGVVEPAAAAGGRYNAVALVGGGRVAVLHRKMLLPTYDVFDEDRYFAPGAEARPWEFGGAAWGLLVCEDLWNDPEYFAGRRASYRADPPALLCAAGARGLINLSASPYHRGRIEERLGLVQHQARRLGVPIALVNQVGATDDLIFDGSSVVVDAAGAVVHRLASFAEDFAVVDWPPEGGEGREAAAGRATLPAASTPPFVLSEAPEPAEGAESKEVPPVRPSTGSEPAPDLIRGRTASPPALRNPHSAIRTPHSALRTPHSALRNPPPDPEELRRALVLGLADYVRKCGFDGVCLGLSGGIDSAVTSVLAVQALGPDRVLALTMPSRFSSPGSVADSAALAEALGVRLFTVPIEATVAALREAAAPLAAVGGGAMPAGVADENLQPRVRQTLLMWLTNAFPDRRLLLLNTGNKSELAVGYCTLYGDLAGGLAVIGDLLKTQVYELAAHLNRAGPMIPPAIIDKPPSAELRPDQRDTDSLPPYETLDGVLERFIERGLPPAAIVAEGFAREVVERIVALVERNEYKRRQAPPVLRVSGRAFGIGWRFPLAAGDGRD